MTIDNIDQYNMVTDQLISFACVTVFRSNMQQTLPPKLRAYRENHSYIIIIVIIIIIIISSSSSRVTSILEQK